MKNIFAILLSCLFSLVALATDEDVALLGKKVSSPQEGADPYVLRQEALRDFDQGKAADVSIREGDRLYEHRRLDEHVGAM